MQALKHITTGREERTLWNSPSLPSPDQFLCQKPKPYPSMIRKANVTQGFEHAEPSPANLKYTNQQFQRTREQQEQNPSLSPASTSSI